MARRQARKLTLLQIGMLCIFGAICSSQLAPLITGLFAIGWIDRGRRWPTFLAVSGLSLPVIYLLGWGLFRTIETWGIQRGKAVLKGWKASAARPASTS